MITLTASQVVAIVVAGLAVLVAVELRFFFFSRGVGPRLGRIEELLSEDLAELNTVVADHEDQIQELKQRFETHLKGHTVPVQSDRPGARE